MIRRHQQKEVEAKKQHLKAEIVQMADRERFAEVEKVVDEEELARIRKRQAGTQVTVESFLAWRKTFDAEQEQLAKSSNVPLPTVTSSTSSAPVSLIDDRSLTGKQFFLLQAAKGASDGKLIAEDEDEEALIREGEADTGAGDNWNRNHDSDDNDEDYEEGDEESDHNDD